jgi:hypothetical protein
MLDGVYKHWDQKVEQQVPQFPRASKQLRALFTSPTISDTFRGHTYTGILAVPGDKNWRAYGASGNLPCPHTVKLPAASSISQETKKESTYSESSTEKDN